MVYEYNSRSRGLFLLCVCGDPENPLRLQILSGELELTYTIEPTETNPDPRGQISISDGKRSLKRSTERTSDFPELKEKPLDRHYPVNPKRLLERFKRVKYAVSSNDARPNQCCIEFLKDKIIAVDGYRLAMSTDPAVNVENLLHSAGGHGRAYDVQGSGLHDLRWRGVGGG